MIIDLDDEEQGVEKRTKFVEEPTSNSPGFSLHLGEEKNVTSSPRSHEISHEQVPLIKQMFTQIEERNQKMKASMEAQAEYQVAPDQTRLLTVMDVEKDQFRIALSHPIDMSIGSSNNFNTRNVTIYVKTVSYTHLTLPTICSV